jgi:hypothetical protein
MGRWILVVRAKTLGYFITFVVAIWSLATGWAALQTEWAVPTTVGLLTTIVYFAIFAGTLAILGFWLYVADRAAGRIQRRISLYEWWLQRRR